MLLLVLPPGALPCRQPDGGAVRPLAATEAAFRRASLRSLPPTWPCLLPALTASPSCQPAARFQHSSGSLHLDALRGSNRHQWCPFPFTGGHRRGPCTEAAARTGGGQGESSRTMPAFAAAAAAFCAWRVLRLGFAVRKRPPGWAICQLRLCLASPMPAGWPATC